MCVALTMGCLWRGLRRTDAGLRSEAVANYTNPIRLSVAVSGLRIQPSHTNRSGPGLNTLRRGKSQQSGGHQHYFVALAFIE